MCLCYNRWATVEGVACCCYVAVTFEAWWWWWNVADAPPVLANAASVVWLNQRTHALTVPRLTVGMAASQRLSWIWGSLDQCSWSQRLPITAANRVTLLPMLVVQPEKQVVHCCDFTLAFFKNYPQGDHSSGKPGNVREFGKSWGIFRWKILSRKICRLNVSV